MIIVVAALIEKDGKYLIAKRSTGDSANLGKWEFPGGKLEPKETEIAAIVREIKEEFELDIKVNKFLINTIYKYPTKTIDLRLYSCSYIGGEVKVHDHSEYKWVRRKEILDFDLAKADIFLANYINENNVLIKAF